MFLDPILRFNWIFYVIYHNEIQHSSFITFFVSFSEVIRRGIWVIFRVENEHCTNVGRYRAQRDAALPYEVASQHPTDEAEDVQQEPEEESHGTGTDGTVLPSQASAASGRDIEQGTTPVVGAQTPASLRRRTGIAADSPVFSALKRAGTTFMMAHAQDYKRKRRPTEAEAAATHGGDVDADADTDSEGDDDDDDD